MSEKIELDETDILDDDELAGPLDEPTDTPDSPVDQIIDIALSPCPPVEECDQALDPSVPWHMHINAAIQGASSAHGTPVIMHVIIGLVKLGTQTGSESPQSPVAADEGEGEEMQRNNPASDLRGAEDALQGSVQGPQG